MEMCQVSQYVTIWSQLSFSDKMIVISIIILGLIIWGQAIMAFFDRKKISRLEKQLKGEKSEANSKCKPSP